MIDIAACSYCSSIYQRLQTNDAVWLTDPRDASQSYILAKSIDAAVTLSALGCSNDELCSNQFRLSSGSDTRRAAREYSKEDRDRGGHLDKAAPATGDADTGSTGTTGTAGPENVAEGREPLGRQEEENRSDENDNGHADTTGDAESASSRMPIGDNAAVDAAETDIADRPAVPEEVDTHERRTAATRATGVNHAGRNRDATRLRQKRKRHKETIGSILDDFGNELRAKQPDAKAIRNFDEQWSEVRAYIMAQDSIEHVNDRLLTQVLETAWNVAGPAVFMEWKTVLSHWRTSWASSTPFAATSRLALWDAEVLAVDRPPSAASHSSPPSDQQSASLGASSQLELSGSPSTGDVLSKARSRMREAYHIVNAATASSGLQHIIYREALANVYKCYLDVQASLSATSHGASPPDDEGKGERHIVSAAKVELFRAIYPGSEPPNTRDDVTSAGKQWRALSRLIDQSRRWYELRDEWGANALVLWPSQVMSHSALERLSRPLYRLLIQLVIRFRVDWLRAFSEPLTKWLNRLLSSQKPPPALIYIETLTEEEISALGALCNPDPRWLSEQEHVRVHELPDSAPITYANSSPTG